MANEKLNNKKSKSATRGILFALLTAVIVVVGAYVGVAVFFQSHFYPGSTINGINMSMSNESSAQDSIRSEIEDYMISVHDRDNRVTYITAGQIDYTYEPDESVSELLAGQNAWQWPVHIMEEHEYSIEVFADYDEDKLLALVEAMDCFKEENIVAPTDAYLEYTSESGYVIVEETLGSEPLLEQILIDVMAAIESRQTVLYLDDDDYVQPNVRSDDENLVERLEAVDKYRSMSITYIIDGYEQVLDGDTIVSWITIEDDLSITIDEDMVAAYAQQLASKYNTYADTRSFTTSLGDTIQIGGGDYGWVIAKAKEAAQIIEDITAGESVEREPCWEQRAFVTGVDDIGNTYIEIDYTNQHLYYYKNGELVIESDIVSGKLSNGNGSPDGVFKIISKQSPATLTGEDYQSDVTYFMPFAYNVGLHDASWRSSFGGSIYKSNGSHGCVNLPYDVVETIYNTVELGTPVIAYYRESVTLSSNSNKISNTYSYSE